MSTYPTFTAGQRVTAGLLAAGQVGTVIQPGDQSSTTTTLANVTGMSFSVVSSATYLIWAYISYTADTTGRFVLNWSAPAGATLQRYTHGPTAATTDTSAASVTLRRRSGTASTWGGDSVAAQFAVAYEQVLLRTSNSGTMQLQFARSGASGTATIRSDSIIQYQRIA